MLLDATRSVRGTVGIVLEATGGSQGLPDGINVNKRGLRDSGGGLRSERLCEVSLALPERYTRVVEGHLQLQRWHKGIWEVI